MKTYIKKLAWEDKNFQAINKLIERHGKVARLITKTINPLLFLIGIIHL